MSSLTKVRTWWCPSNQVWEVVLINERGLLEYGRGVCELVKPTARQVLDHLRKHKLTHAANIKFYDHFVVQRDNSNLTGVHDHARIED